MPVDDVVWPPHWKLPIARHSKASILHFFVSVLAEMPLSFSPDISVLFYCFILSPTIAKVKVPCDESDIQLLVDLFDRLQLIHSFVCAI
jgi:hypothetical protein